MKSGKQSCVAFWQQCIHSLATGSLEANKPVAVEQHATEMAQVLLSYIGSICFVERPAAAEQQKSMEVDIAAVLNRINPQSFACLDPWVHTAHTS